MPITKASGRSNGERRASAKAAKPVRRVRERAVSSEGQEAEPAPSKNSVQSLLLGLRVLEAIGSSSKERGITELAHELKITKWRIFRHLHSLCEEGYVIQDPKSGKFRAGRRSYAIFRSLLNRFSFVSEARPEMLALRGMVGHTIVLTAPVDDAGVVVVDTLEGLHAVQFNLNLGVIFDLHSSAHGKAALAFGPPEWRERALTRELRRYTDYTITDPAQLSAALDQIKRQGWATAPEENYRGLNALVAPIFSENGTFMGSVGAFGSTELVPHTPKREDVDAVVSIGRRISMRLGWNN